MVAQAREWESSGEYARAVECYLKVTNQLTNDTELMIRCWKKVSKFIFIGHFPFSYLAPSSHMIIEAETFSGK